jgi:hypothetical protein
MGGQRERLVEVFEGVLVLTGVRQQLAQGGVDLLALRKCFVGRYILGAAQRLFKMVDRLVVGKQLFRLSACQQLVAQRARPILAQEGVVSDEWVVAFGFAATDGTTRFQKCGDLVVMRAAVARRKAVIADLLHHGVFESVNQFRQALRFAHRLVLL